MRAAPRGTCASARGSALLAHQSPLNAQDRELHRFRFRVAVAAVAVAVAFFLLIARFVHLQVMQHDYYTTRAEDNRISLVPIVPNRGCLLYTSRCV